MIQSGQRSSFLVFLGRPFSLHFEYYYCVRLTPAEGSVRTCSRRIRHVSSGGTFIVHCAGSKGVLMTFKHEVGLFCAVYGQLFYILRAVAATCASADSRPRDARKQVEAGVHCFCTLPDIHCLPRMSANSVR